MIKRYLEFITETSKYKSIESDNFVKFFNKIVGHFKEIDQSIIDDFKLKLFEYVSQDQSDLYPINFFDKKYKKLIDVIHVLDNKNAEIMIHKNKKSVMDVSLPDLKPIWKDESKKIYVYRAENVFQSIALGKGTNFCISSDPKNGNNYFYAYLHGPTVTDTIYANEQSSTIYFVKSPSQKAEYQTLAIDVRDPVKIKKGYTIAPFLYTDVRNSDRFYTSYQQMVNDEYTSPDIKFIPESIFKFVEVYPTKEEVFLNKDMKGLIFQLKKNEIIPTIKESLESGKLTLYGLGDLIYKRIRSGRNKNTKMVLDFFLKSSLDFLKNPTEKSNNHEGYFLLLILMKNSYTFRNSDYDDLPVRYRIFLDILNLPSDTYNDVDDIHKTIKKGTNCKTIKGMKVSDIKKSLSDINVPKKQNKDKLEFGSPHNWFAGALPRILKLLNDFQKKYGETL